MMWIVDVFVRFNRWRIYRKIMRRYERAKKEHSF